MRPTPSERENDSETLQRLDQKHLQHARDTSARTRHAKNLVSIAAAQEAVMNTPELFENIIVHLPLEGLFVVQRVCKHWGKIIADSVPIKRKMFLEASGDPIEYDRVYNYCWNELILEKFRDGLGHRDSDLSQFSRSTFNPLVFTPEKSKLISAIIRMGMNSETLSKLFFEEIIENHRPSTWQSMYITNPPCNNFEISGEWTNHPRGCSKVFARRTVVEPSGVTLGSLLKALVDAPGLVSIYNGKCCAGPIENTTLRQQIERLGAREEKPGGGEAYEGSCSWSFRFYDHFQTKMRRAMGGI